MGDNHYHFAYPPHNCFIQHYMQQHAIMSRYFQRLNSMAYYGAHFPNSHYTSNVYDHADYSSSCSSSSSSCSSSSSSCSSSGSSKTSSIEHEEEECYADESSEDESECEYEFNVDAILAMRAAKEELKKEEAELKEKESSESKETESSESKDESEDEDSIVLVESDKEDFEFVDLSSTKILESKLCRSVGKFHKAEEIENKKKLYECLYGDKSSTILAQETAMSLNFDRLCDEYQPSLWPVLPLRL